MKEVSSYYTKEAFEAKGTWGILASIDIHTCDPELIRSASAIKEFVIQLCDLIKMKRYGDPVIVHFGEDERVAGYSMTQLIETSLISAHFANQTNNVYLDIFSCKYYEPEKAAEFSKTFFKGKDFNLNVILRK
jgi:S-adenosylmethionine/arginine decarboxylase-like enzyme